ncbi:MAG: DNA polymerase III subunit chi [Syntrophobacteraceae bacterium]
MPLLFVETSVSEQRVELCRHADRLFGEGRKVEIVVDSTSAAQYIDQLLWTFSQASFVPHAVFNPETGGPGDEPVLICIGERLIEGFDALLCDAPVGLEFMGRFETAVHFVLRDDPERRQQSRLLWQKARDLGLSPVHISYARPA